MSHVQPMLNHVTMPLGPDRAGIEQSLAAAAAAGEPGGMEKAAKDFESVLLHKLMEEMARTVPDSGLLTSGVSKQVRGIFWLYLAQEVADGGGLGLWRDIQRYTTGQSQTDPPTPTVEQDQ